MPSRVLFHSRYEATATAINGVCELGERLFLPACCKMRFSAHEPGRIGVGRFSFWLEHPHKSALICSSGSLAVLPHSRIMTIPRAMTSTVKNRP